MSAPIKIGLIGGGIVLVGGTATYLAVFHDPMPSYTLLFKEANTSTTYGTNKYANKYLSFFVQQGDNKDWWEWSFRQLKKQGISSGNFSTEGDNAKITQGYDASTTDNGNSKALNKICKKAYESESTKVKGSPDASSSDEYDETQVWQFCSAVRGKPTTVQTYGQDGYKEESGKKPIGKEIESDLISVFDPNNRLFWEIKNKEFLGVGEFESNGISVVDTDKYFKKGQTDKTHIKQLCKNAYEKQSASASEVTTPTKDETKKYCSLTKATS